VIRRKTEIEIVNIHEGPTNIESFYDEVLASADVVEKAI
jgi:hypothetical protein